MNDNTPWTIEQADRPPRPRGRNRHRRQGRRRHRPGPCRGRVQHRPDGLPGDPDRPLLSRPDRHLHLPPYRQCRRQRRGYRGPDAGRPPHRRRRDLQGRHHRTVELPLARASRRMAEVARHHRPHRYRYPGAHRLDPGARRAERRHRPRPAGQFRRRGTEEPRRRAWSGLENLDLAREATSGQSSHGARRHGSGTRATAPATARPASTSSPSTTASSATSSGCSPGSAAG